MKDKDDTYNECLSIYNKSIRKNVISKMKD